MIRILLFVLLFISAIVEASTLEEEVGLIHDRVDLKLRLMNTVIQTNQRLELALGGLEREGLTHREFDERWAKAFESITKDYIEEQMSIAPLSAGDKNILRKFFDQLKWSEISQLHLKTWHKLRPIARAKGVTLMAAIVVANILNYVIPYTLTMLGQPYLGAVIFAAPVNPPTVFVYQVITRAKLEIEMRKILGGAKGVRAYRQLERQVLEELSLSRATDYFSALPIDESSQFKVRKGGLFDRIVGLFGLRQEDLSLNSIKNFLKDEGALDPVYERLLKDDELSESVKASMLIQEISKSELFSKFKLRFSKNIVQRPRVPLEMMALEKWVNKILRSKSAEDIFAQIQNAPNSVHPYHLLTTWEQIILPELAIGEQLGYKQIRALSTRFHSFRLKKELFLEELTFEGVRGDLLSYYRSALRVNRKSCFHTPGEAIEQLLKAH